MPRLNESTEAAEKRPHFCVGRGTGLWPAPSERAKRQLVPVYLRDDDWPISGEPTACLRLAVE